MTEIALVTGGGRGIGRAISMELAAKGYYVIINYHSRKDAAEAALAEIKESGGDGETVQFDVANGDETAAAIKDLLDRHKYIKVLINNAGITSDGLFPMTSRQSWENVIDTSLRGFYNVTKPVLRSMIRQKNGNIIAIASISGIIGNAGQVNYSAAKAGLIGACKALAKEMAKLGIRVNAVAPGLIETEMIKDLPIEAVVQHIPMGRVGKPEEVAKAVGFLCSDDASYITGQVLSVNGGMI
ncbi:MAG TPA: 3-oxoacyl-ACP reductase FabG [Desulfomonilia bacterium]